MSTVATNAKISPWPHRLAVALVCVVFPLIWVGGLVTTYDAGMAVPDWPGTYGYNLLLYPWTTWIAGPWDLFIEHGHRLLGAAAGLITIALVVVVFLTDKRLLVRGLAIGALVLVIVQGVLGGQRVLFDARHIALVHGCVGPLFFAYCACLAVITSQRWRQRTGDRRQGTGEPGTGNREPDLPISNQQSAILNLPRAAFIGLVLAYVQLVLGAHLRHLPDDGSPRLFRLILLFHVIVAVALAGHVIGLAVTALRRAQGERWVTLPAAGLVLLLLAQLVLGVSTLIVKYGWPPWLGGELFDPSFTVTAQGFWSSMIVTGHVANGSLILATLAVLWLRSARLYGWRGVMSETPVGCSSLPVTGSADRLELGTYASLEATA